MVDKAGTEKQDPAEKPEAKIVVFNKGQRPYKVGKDLILDPQATAALPVAQAEKLLKTYKKDLVDVSKMAKTASVGEIDKAIKDRDAKIVALQAKIDELTVQLSAALAGEKKDTATKAADKKDKK